MGRDKALLPLPGATHVPYVAHLADLLSELCGEVALVTRDAAQASIYVPYLPSSIHLISDQIPSIGPLMGLASGLRAIHSSHALVTAVDMPFLQSALVRFLLSQPLDEQLLIPLVNDMPQVLLAVYPRTVLPLVEARLLEGRRDPRSLLELARVRYVEEALLRQVDPDLRSFLNINTPGELAQTFDGSSIVDG